MVTLVKTGRGAREEEREKREGSRDLKPTAVHTCINTCLVALEENTCLASHSLISRWLGNPDTVQAPKTGEGEIK